MSPKQKKLAAKAPPPNKIDAKDFAVLKEEKAKGRGMGLQDESVKPGKVMKAKHGKMMKYKRGSGLDLPVINSVKPTVNKTKRAQNLSRMKIQFNKQRSRAGINPNNLDKILSKTKNPYSDLKATTAKGPKQYPSGSPSEFLKKRLKLSGVAKAVSASRIGKIALGVGTAGVAAQQYLKSKMNKKKEVKKKMSGGMMKPMGYTKGGGADMGKEPTSKMKTQEKMLIYANAKAFKNKGMRLTDRDIEKAKSLVKGKMSGGSIKKYSEGMSYKDMAPYGGKYAKIKKNMRDEASKNVRRLMTSDDAYSPETRYVTAEQRKDRARRRRVTKTTDQVYLKGVANKMKEDMGSGTSTSILTPSQARERRIIRPERRRALSRSDSQSKIRERLDRQTGRQEVLDRRPPKRKLSNNFNMGGMMMQKPMGYKHGTSVTASCKLGRNKPTKIT